MKLEEMVNVLNEINKELDNAIPNHLLEEVLKLVMKSPLDDDRGRCQEQIQKLINQYCKSDDHVN